MLTVYQIINSPVTSNCFVIYDKAVGPGCMVVDPGSKSDALLFDFLINEGLSPKYIILTHEHFDHCWGVNELVKKYNIPIVCSSLCSECIRFEKRNCSVFYDNKECFIIDSNTISIESLDYNLLLGETNLTFISTPGHTDASICFTIGHCLFTGDTLIKDEKTVTKLPTGSVTKLMQSQLLFQGMQGEGYDVYPGHGDVFHLDGYDLGLMTGTCKHFTLL